MAVLNPDLAFIRALNGAVDNSLKKCIQCGTCSASCSISPPSAPFPRKEMARANLGMKETLLFNPDIWLCYQCNDCTRNCPRGARPGDVLSAIRKESIAHFAFPAFLARWTQKPAFLLLWILFPALLLGGAIWFQDRLAALFGTAPIPGDDIVFSHSAFLPHGLLNRFFFSVFVLSAVAAAVSAARLWRSFKQFHVEGGTLKKTRSLSSSIVFALKEIWTHERFDSCDAAQSRRTSHFLVIFGFSALSVVTLWIITAGINPFITGRFVYPFSFLSPFKIMANAGGIALLLGTVFMIYERLKTDPKGSKSSYFDWLFLLTLFFIVVTGFATEGFHYLRLTPHRHVVYFVHLVSVTLLLLSLPFTKFAHIVYRTTALVFAAHIGREAVNGPTPATLKGEGDATQ